MASRRLAQDKWRGWRLARGCAGVVYNMSWYKLSGALLAGVRPIPFGKDAGPKFVLRVRLWGDFGS